MTTIDQPTFMRDAPLGTVASSLATGRPGCRNVGNLWIGFLANAAYDLAMLM